MPGFQGPAPQTSVRYWRECFDAEQPLEVLSAESQEPLRSKYNKKLVQRAYLLVRLDSGEVLQVCVKGDLADQFNSQPDGALPARVVFVNLGSNGYPRWAAKEIP